MKTNIQARINEAKTKFESKEFKNIVEAQKKVEESLKVIEGCKVSHLNEKMKNCLSIM